jgi:hypothetical protein
MFGSVEVTSTGGPEGIAGALVAAAFVISGVAELV